MSMVAKSTVKVIKILLILIILIGYIVVNKLKSSIDILPIETSHSR